MNVRVELYGIPRRRAGTAAVNVDADSLGDALSSLRASCPALSECIDGRSLRAGYLANVNGTTFTSDPATPLREGDTILILSSDAGG